MTVRHRQRYVKRDSVTLNFDLSVSQLPPVTCFMGIFLWQFYDFPFLHWEPEREG